MIKNTACILKIMNLILFNNDIYALLPVFKIQILIFRLKYY